jgi:hypothetical protein
VLFLVLDEDKRKRHGKKQKLQKKNQIKLSKLKNALSAEAQHTFMIVYTEN